MYSLNGIHSRIGTKMGICSEALPMLDLMVLMDGMRKEWLDFILTQATPVQSLYANRTTLLSS